jgi:hypothetical protein
MGLSVVVLLAAFFLRAFLWHRLLARFDVKVPFDVALTSQFRTTLTKYVPGKVWSMLSSAQVVAARGHSLRYCTYLAACLNLCQIVAGLMVGIVGALVFGFEALQHVVILVAAGCLIVFGWLFSRARTIPPKLRAWYVRLTKAPVEVEKFPPIADVLLLSAVFWILIGYAFWLFLAAVGFRANWSPVLLQPLAHNIGIIAVFAPAGLGVRESVMIGYLTTLADFTAGEATTVSVISRVWSLAVDAIMFGIGLATGAARIVAEQRRPSGHDHRQGDAG